MLQNEKALRNSFLIAHRIAKKIKTYSDGDFMKECLIDVAQEICPKMVSEIQKISLSRWTVAKRIDVLADDICVIFKDKVKNCVSWSFATDEIMNQKDTAQLAIFVKAVDRELNETEELLSLQSIKNTTTGADIFTEVLNAFETFEIDLTNLYGIAIDGGRWSGPYLVLA